MNKFTEAERLAAKLRAICEGPSIAPDGWEISVTMPRVDFLVLGREMERFSSYAVGTTTDFVLIKIHGVSFLAKD